MEKKTGLILACLLIISMAAAGAYAMGFKGKGVRGFGAEGKIMDSIKAGDYNAYRQAVESLNLTLNGKELTQEEFNAIVQRYKQEAPLIDAEQKARQAAMNNDFSSWKDAMNARIDAEKMQVNEENFNSMVKMHSDIKANNSTMMHKGMKRGEGKFFHPRHK